jgi:hypothetical protein
MLAFQRWVQAPRRRPPVSRPGSDARRAAASALVEKLTSLKKPAHVDQWLDGLVSDDALCTKAVEALAGVLQAEGVAAITVPGTDEEDFIRLDEALVQAASEADEAELMGTASPYQQTLRMRASVTYRQDGPPAEVVDLIAAYQKAPLALLLLAVVQHLPVIVAPEIVLELGRVVHAGLVARVTHLASLGYSVPESLVPLEQRLDLESLVREHEAVRESFRREAGTFTASRSSSRTPT